MHRRCRRILFSEQTEQGTEDQYQYETYQETDDSADEDVVDLLLVDDRVDHDDDDQDDDTGDDTEDECSQESDEETDECRRIAEIESTFLCHVIPIRLDRSGLGRNG